LSSAGCFDPSLPLPNFFLVGAAKSGTTSLANYLDQHPGVFVTRPKEPNFFAFEPDEVPSVVGPGDASHRFDMLLKYSVTSPAAYQRLYAPAGQASARGEASVRYLYYAEVPGRIAAAVPDARILLVLRDPVRRMYSHYHMNVRSQLEPLGFRDAIEAEPQRVEQGWGWDWHYVRVGRYGEQLERYLRHFSREQIHVEWHDDLVRQPAAVMGRIFHHLGVDPRFVPDLTSRKMVGSTPRNRLLRRVIREENLVKRVAQALVPRRLRKAASRWIEQRNQQRIPSLDDKLYRELAPRFEDDRRKLADLLHREVPW
jgi:hypothetical protein